MSLTLVIGNKNYSSWSLRAWLFTKHSGLEFDEIVLPLYQPQFGTRISQFSPAGRVPVLIDGDVRVWDSLAICEYLAEKTGSGWPRARAARALARSVSAEMHSGFANLREQCPMNSRARDRRVAQTPELLHDVKRIDESWQECRRSFGAGGSWLFGSFSIADAMYAPVVLRFNTYGCEISAASRAYVATLLADPHLGDWMRAAEAEPFVLEETDVVGR